MSIPLQVLRFLRDANGRGVRTALVTITGIVGSSSRAEGALMAVCEDGSWCGSLSGGCVEAAIAGEAIQTILSGRARSLRLGAGSPLIDIRLPCGGGLDLLIVPNQAAATIAAACDLLTDRKPLALRLGRNGGIAADEAAASFSTGWQEDAFHARIDPPLRLVLVGHGEELEALALLGGGYGADILALTPDAAAAAAVRRSGGTVELLKTPSATPLLVADPYTAIVFLFHDHDWELQLLAQAAGLDAFYIGSMGSPRTQAGRLTALRAAGISEDRLQRLQGPIGLIRSSRDPRTLALSVLAEVVERFRHTRCDRRDEDEARPARISAATGRR